MQSGVSICESMAEGKEGMKVSIAPLVCVCVGGGGGGGVGLSLICRHDNWHNRYLLVMPAK